MRWPPMTRWLLTNWNDWNGLWKSDLVPSLHPAGANPPYFLSWRCTGIVSLLQVSESPEGPNFGQRDQTWMKHQEIPLAQIRLVIETYIPEDQHGTGSRYLFHPFFLEKMRKETNKPPVLGVLRFEMKISSPTCPLRLRSLDASHQHHIP